MTGATAEASDDHQPSGESLCADVLANDAPAVLPQTSCADVHAMLRRDETLSAVAVVRAGQPLGLVSRLEFLANMAKPYWPELFNAKPISKLMDPSPLIVEWDHRIEEVSDLLLSSKPKAMVDGFIVTRNGSYSGIATATELMRMTVAIAGQRFDRLSKALHQVTEANGAKTKFLANVSHELRTPLNAIIGFSDLLGRKLYGPLTEQQSEHVGYIHHSGQLLLSLVEDLLNLSVTEAGKMELHEESVDLTSLLAGCAKLLEPRAASAGVRLERHAAQSAEHLIADAVKLKQIVLNLLTNAIKFTQVGGHVNLRLATTPDGDLRILVSDNGIGIREKDIDVILQPFGQAHDKRAHPHQGAGLGLPLTKALVELHGGQLFLRSRLNFGTEVEVRLPAARRDLKPEDQLPATA
ncbi:histidine kinase [Pelagibius litoralis]|uniref:histidine kinase n=1 Tax=Pelagibius litoralis TaxID=374515 RepID=A0A967C879_9PROT|nr:ATP-binding protein [Pelagibius litoralis]NIA68212.1 histidine kinase [Pelagibius litoralis]